MWKRACGAPKSESEVMPKVAVPGTGGGLSTGALMGAVKSEFALMPTATSASVSAGCAG